ncbi:transcriptional regulator GutM [Aeromonas veronii]|uniref:transcriptional regulator GutM n=1 Tax=Aeromonas veronii TaxID=654 RepID=UPI002F3ED24D
MDATTTLIVIAVIAWASQIVTGFIQVRAFNRMLKEISTKGVVKIGKTSSRWKPKTLVIIAHDQNGMVVDARVMKGVTVFTRPKPFSDLIHRRLPLPENWLNSQEASVKEAIICALSTN